MKMRLTILALSLIAAVHAQEPQADADSTYFYPAASMYVQGDSFNASNLVAQGLSLFPDDGKLKRLKELLDQQQEQEQDQQNQDDQQQDENQDQEQNDQQENDQQQDPSDDQQDEQEQQPDEQEQEQEPEQQEQPEPPRAEHMSQDEAERLLDAMKQEEETKRLQMHPVMGAPVKVDKDW